MNYLNLARTLIEPVVAVLCAFSVIFLQLPRLNFLEQPENKLEYIRHEKQEALRLNVLKKLPSFGFNNLMGDWAYLNFVQYFGDDAARKHTGYSLVPDYFEIVVARNPRLVNAYFYLSPATSLFAGRPDKSVVLIEQGLHSISPRTHPKAYLLWLYKGIDELLFLGDRQAARRSYEIAAQWASNSSDPSSQEVATRARETVQFLNKNPNSVKAQIGAWSMILDNALDDASRQLAVQNIRKLGGQVVVTPNGTLLISTPEEK